MGSTRLPVHTMLRTERGRALDLRHEVGAGGEARVFGMPGDDRFVVKVYREPTPAYARKLAQMLAAPPVLDAGAGVRLAWPREALVDERGMVAGFVMPRASGDRVFEVYNPLTRRALPARFHWQLLHRVGVNLAVAFAALHQRGYLVGDVNESNILVAPDGVVTLVDTDGFQVPDPATGQVFRARVGRPEYTPPELQGADFGVRDRTELHDRFGLGVLLFLLLMEGTHPFAARVAPGEEPPPLEERIRQGLFPYAGDRAERAGIHAPRLAPPFAALHPELRELFVECFERGHADPSARPAPADWLRALAAAEADLVVCAQQAQHRYASHLTSCPWCRRAQLLGGRDPFPLRAEKARPRRAAPAASEPEPTPAPAPSPHAPRRRFAYLAPQPSMWGPFADPLVWILPVALFFITSGRVVPFSAFALIFLVVRATKHAGPRRPMSILLAIIALTLAAMALGTSFAKDPYDSEPFVSQDETECYRGDPGCFGEESLLPLPDGVSISLPELLEPEGAFPPGSRMEPVTEPSVRGATLVPGEVEELRRWLKESGSGPAVATAEVTVGGDGRPVPSRTEVIGVDEGTPLARAVIALLDHVRFRPSTSRDMSKVTSRVRVIVTLEPAP